MMALTPECAAKVSKLIPRLASDHDGEVVATAKAIIRVLASAGASLHDLSEALFRPALMPHAPPRRPVQRAEWEIIAETADDLLDGGLNIRETDFVTSIRERAVRYRDGFRMTEKQEKWWNDILAR